MPTTFLPPSNDADLPKL
jgi:transcription initiation factor TFIID TATA-box-binding protein